MKLNTPLLGLLAWAALPSLQVALCAPVPQSPSRTIEPLSTVAGTSFKIIEQNPLPAWVKRGLAELAASIDKGYTNGADIIIKKLERRSKREPYGFGEGGSVYNALEPGFAGHVKKTDHYHHSPRHLAGAVISADREATQLVKRSPYGFGTWQDEEDPDAQNFSFLDPEARPKQKGGRHGRPGVPHRKAAAPLSIRGTAEEVAIGEMI